MALQTFILQPSADIHLLPGHNIQVQVIGYEDPAVTTNPINSQCTFTIANTGIATIDTSGKITPVSTGITFLTVEHGASGNKIVARVWVHTSLSNVYLGNKSGSVNVGTDNFQPTIFGIFDPGDMEDISGHPFVTYESLSPAQFSVNPVTGRVSGIATGNGTLRIKEASTGTTVGDLPITIKDPLATARAIVERVTFKGAGAEKRNILFLGEGFSTGEEVNFKRIVRDLDRKMRTSRLHQPFRLLSNDYNTWMAFDASSESGVALGPAPTRIYGDLRLFDIENKTPATAGHYSLYELIDLVGLPTARHFDASFTMATAITEWSAIPGFVGANLEADVFDAWIKNTKMITEQMIVKNSVYGLMYGRRLGDISATDSTLHADNRWYRQDRTPTTFFMKDPRRTGTTHFYLDTFKFISNAPILSQLWTDEFFTYLNNLKRKDTPASDPLFDIGHKWNLGGSDQALVVVIVNDEKHGANYKLMPNIFGAISAGRNGGLLESSVSVESVPDHTPNTHRYFLNSLVSHVLHELCHGIFLGDEYDDIRNEGHNAPSSAAEISLTEVFHNINTQNRINANGSKWTKMPRISKSSALLKQASINATTMTVDVELFPNEAAHWAVGDELIMVTKNLNVEADTDFYSAYNRHRTFVIGPLNITAITGDKLTLGGLATLPPAGVVFEKGSMIFLPVMHNGSALRLILPGVITWMNNGTGNLPSGQPRVARFLTDKGGHCTESTSGVLANTPYPIAGVNIAFHDRHWLVGTHEGAGTYNCEVVRASAVCKMRREYWYETGHRGHFRYCHVCRYYIVQEFNASKHAALDAMYPGRPV